MSYEFKYLKPLCFAFILFFSVSLFSENTGFITGIVIDKNGEPLIGVTVSIKGTTKGTITGSDGRFSIPLTESAAVLIVSYIGMESQEVKVTKNNPYIEIKLLEDNKLLDEIVVVGYGVQKKINLTGAVESVSGAKLLKRPVASTTLALQGMAAGVTVTSTSGQPGKEGETIRIRGIGTLNNNDPLILVDGVANSLNAVNPNDIENISILKDAASASIYGSRAANGVILITTKRANDNKLSINFNGNIGVQTLVDQPNFLGAIDYMELYDLATANDTRNFITGAPGGVKYGRDYITNYKSKMALDPYNYPDTDWAKVTYDSPAIQQQYNLSVSGGNDKLKVLTSINYQDQKGIFPDSYMKRYSIRMNADYKFSEKFSASVDLSGRYSIVSEPGTSASAVMGEIRRTAPIYPYVTPSGNPAFVSIGSNTWATSQEKYSGYNRDYYQEGIENIKATYRPIKDLSLDFTYTPKLNYNSNKLFNNKINFFNVDDEPVELAQMRSLRHTKEYVLENQLKLIANYNNTIGQHNFSVLGGFEQITNYRENVIARRENSSFEYDELNAFPVLNQSGSGGASEWALQSFFGRANYDFGGKYLLEANLRYDGSSRFAKNYKWGVFPSFSLGWRVSEEAFLKNVSWLDNLKIRGSWGKLGNQQVGNYPFSTNINIDQWLVFNQIVSNGYASSDYAFKDISWETTTMTNLGIDLAFWGNRLGITFDYYIKKTDDILMNLDIPSIMGYNNSPLQNAGKVQNKGWDLTISYNDKYGDFSYQITGNLSDVKNKILDMKGVVSNFDNIKTNREGYPINSLWGLQANGVFSSFNEAQAYTVNQYGKLQGGDIRYIDQLTVDTNGDGIADAGDGSITGDDYKVIGNTIPRYTYSFDISMQYKNFDLGIFFQGVGKRDGYLRGDLAWAFNNGGKVQAWQKKEMWKEGESNSRYPRMFVSSENNVKPSSFWVQNAAYMRLKNVQLGYTLPKNVLRSTFIQGARIYISCQNMFTFKHMTEGYDPEQDPNNAQNSLPLLKSYSFGFNFNF